MTLRRGCDATASTRDSRSGVDDAARILRGQKNGAPEADSGKAGKLENRRRIGPVTKLLWAGLAAGLATASTTSAQTLVGAIASDENRGRAGWAVDYETAAAAERAALEACGTACRVVVTFGHCGAYAADQEAGSTAYGWTEAFDSAGAARQGALRECRARGGASCRVRAWACNGTVVEESLGLDRASRRGIQQGLAARGFDPGGADGLFGPRTRAAIRGWQRAQGMRATGYLDREGAESLRNGGNPNAAGREAETAGTEAAADARAQQETVGCSIFDPGTSWRNPGWRQTDRHPVTCVSWDDAREYLSWLSRKTGESYRLPTEEEWSRAATGTPERGCGSDADQEERGPCLVGSYSANATGLSDMVGNVWEWTADCWEGDCGSRVIRGNSWNTLEWAEFVGMRSRSDVGDRRVSVGFRVAKTLD